MKNKNLYLTSFVIIALAAGYLFLTKSPAFNFYSSQEQESSSPVDTAVAAQFDYLSKNGNTNCSKVFTESISSMPDDAHLRGSCCSPMSLHRYGEQVGGLKKYKDIPQISSDPYNIPAKLAKELIGYNQIIRPTTEEQKILDEGAAGSDEKGFCCCKCWRWEAHEGMSKFLVRNYHFTAQQISELLDLQDGCGGDEEHHH